MLRKLQRIRQTCLIWLGRSIREKKRFCAIEGKERLIDCFTHEQDVWSRSFIHKTVKIYSRNHIKQLLTIFCGKPSYSLKQKMIPSGPPPPLPAPVLDPWSSLLGCSSYLNEFTDTARSNSLYFRQFFHRNNHFFFPYPRYLFFLFLFFLTQK